MSYPVTLFTDLDRWTQVPAKAYGLPFHDLGGCHFSELRTLGGKKILSSGAFATDGGAPQFHQNLQRNVSEITSWLKEHGFSYALVKSRQDLKSESFTNLKTNRDYVSLVLPLDSDPETTWKTKIKSKTRNQVRKGQNQGFRVEMGGVELVDELFQVLARVWRTLGTPTHSLNYYKAWIQVFQDKSQIIILRDGDRPIAGSLLIKTDGTIHNPHAGTLPEYKSSCANNLLYWEIIKFAIQQKCHSFDMGRSAQGQGTLKFKKSWGAQEVPLYYHYIHEAQDFELPSLQSSAKWLTSLWKKLPLPVTLWLGPLLIRHVP